ncbi:hypothetical protein KOW79_000154 [Hemibagrus wyckioides]|uniref:Uncharacterized protein n=1 Tax=Hemibagrus wyckioides TaxID=337641 RepID=A0A9D3P7H1_9TELE|nr:hypothetical protein KOW79_000154 [Hemibagrus wyckioides]
MVPRRPASLSSNNWGVLKKVFLESFSDRKSHPLWTACKCQAESFRTVRKVGRALPFTPLVHEGAGNDSLVEDLDLILTGASPVRTSPVISRDRHVQHAPLRSGDAAIKILPTPTPRVASVTPILKAWTRSASEGTEIRQ